MIADFALFSYSSFFWHHSSIYSSLVIMSYLVPVTIMSSAYARVEHLFTGHDTLLVIVYESSFLMIWPAGLRCSRSLSLYGWLFSISYSIFFVAAFSIPWFIASLSYVFESLFNMVSKSSINILKSSGDRVAPCGVPMLVICSLPCKAKCYFVFVIMSEIILINSG